MDARMNNDEQDIPLFALRKLDWEGRQYRSSNKSAGKARAIQQVEIANRIVVVATTGCSIIRWRLSDNTNKEPEEVEIGKSDESIENLILDPSGHHLLISMKGGDAYYLHSKSTKPKKLSKLSGAIECAAFDQINSSELNTRSFLLGTSVGTIYEMSIDSSGKEKLCQQLFQLDGQIAITSLYFENLLPHDSSTSSLNEQKNRYLILFATSSPTRLYHVVGTGSFQQIFSDFAAHGSESYTELPGELRRAELQCYSKMNNGRSQYFALMTGAGIYTGSLLSMSKSETVMMEAQLIPYVESAESSVLPAILLKPVSFSVSEFHFLILRGENLQAISSLNGTLVQELILSRHEGMPLRLSRDIIKDSTLIYTSKSIFQVQAFDEARHVWSIYLNKALSSGDDRMFELAYEYSRTKERKAQVMLSRAEFNANNNQWDKAATYLARSGASFDEAAIRLCTVDSPSSHSSTNLSVKLEAQGNRQICIRSSGNDLNPLRIFLLEVLKALPMTAKSQRAMLCVWLMEIYLHQITAASLNGKAEQELSIHRTSECIEFIRTNRVNLDASTMLHLIISRDNRQLTLFFAKIIGDYFRVVTMLLTESKYFEAIAVLHDAPFEKISTFIYEVAPVLVKAEPEAAVELFLAKSQLSPSLLLPALLRYTELLDRGEEDYLSLDYQGNTKNFACYYFEELMKRHGVSIFESVDDEIYFIEPFERNYDIWRFSNPDPIIIATLAWLLAKYDESANEIRICKFMQELCALHKAQALQDVAAVDVDFILRQCRAYGRKKSVVYAFILLDLPLVAAEEALSFDAGLAKAIAVFETDPQIAHEIWLKIAESVISTVIDMKQAVNLIEESQHVLTIEDLLPILPDFTEIDLLKEQICQSLDKCGVSIQEVKVEMQELASSVENTLQELHGMKNRAYSTASSHQRCEFCVDLLLQDQFYLFPCSHGFHSTCLLSQAFSLLPAGLQKILEDLQASLRSLSLRAKENDSRAKGMLEAVYAEIDGIIAADCPLCGFAIIRSVSESLIPSEEEKEASQWRL